MKNDVLAKWTGAERKRLIKDLARDVKTRKGHQRELFLELLHQMEEPVEPITLQRAAEIMGMSWKVTSPSNIHAIATPVRTAIEKGGSQYGATLSSPPYEIQVTVEPPVRTTKYPEPCIGLILADASDFFVGDVLRGVSSVLRKKYDLIVEVSAYDHKAEAENIKRLSERTRGILFVPVSDHVLDSAISALKGTPCVLIDRYLTNLPKLPSVHPADHQAGRAAAHYLKERGCRRILVIEQGSRAHVEFQITPLNDRAAGCVEASDDMRVKALPIAGTDEEGGIAALEVFERHEPIQPTDGIFALTDHLALGCRKYLSEKHPELNIPIISVEGRSFGEYLTPQLVSIQFNDFEMGRWAAEILIEIIEKGEPPAHPTFPNYLIEPHLLKPSPLSDRRVKVSLST